MKSGGGCAHSSPARSGLVEEELLGVAGPGAEFPAGEGRDVGLAFRHFPGGQAGGRPFEI